MAYSWDDIRGIVEYRRSQDEELKKAMIEVRDRYNGDYVIPLPSVKGQPEMDAPVPRLIADGVDGLAMAASSVRPIISVPALDATKDRGVRSLEYANIRRRALYGAWHSSHLMHLLRRLYRQHGAYGSFSTVVVPDFKNKRARIEMRDSLTAYPEPRTAEDIRRPENAAFIFGRSGHWLAQAYPEFSERVKKLGLMDDIWDLVEWIDEDHVVIGVLGPRTPGFHHRIREGEFSVELRRWPNRAGRCTATTMWRVTLDRVMGQMTSIIGTTDLMSKMMALDVLAAEKAIFPDRFVIGQDGRPPQLLSGEWKDGRTGKTNILADVSQLGELQSSPGPLTHPVLDRLESAARQSGAIHPFFSGQQPGSNLRTGRAIDNFQAFSIEPRIQEMQETMAEALSMMNEAILEVEKGYWGSKKFHVFSGWPSDLGYVDYEPNTHFEGTDNVVSYAYPGTDAQGAAVTTAQMVGAGMMSRHTGMVRHPFVEDADSERRIIVEESLEQAVLVSVQQAAAQGSLPVIDLARIKTLVKQGLSIEEAVAKADEEARERQTTQAPPAEEGQVAAPATAPGLAEPGVGAESPPGEAPPTVEPPPQGLQNLRQLLVSLRGQ